MTDVNYYIDAARSQLRRTATDDEILHEAARLAKEDRLERLVEFSHKLVPLAKQAAGTASSLTQPHTPQAYAERLVQLRSIVEQLQDGCAIVLATSQPFQEKPALELQVQLDEEKEELSK